MISIDWNTRVISIPQSYLTLVSGTLYDLDTNQFRLDLKDIEDGEGIPYPDTHRHNTEVTVAGTTFARTIEIINNYSLTFEDTGSAYSVRLVGSNNNFFDIEGGILNPTDKVTVISGNSAGLIVSSGSGSGATAQEVWEYDISGISTDNLAGRELQKAVRNARLAFQTSA